MVRRRTLSLFATAIAVGSLTLGVSIPAEAGLNLRLSDNGGASWVNGTIQSPGVILLNSAIGNWSVNVTTGLSKGAGPDYAATNDYSKMDLNSVDVSSTGGGSLLIQLTDTDFPAFTGPAGVLQGSVGGTTSGSVAFTAWKSSTNEEFSSVKTVDLGSVPLHFFGVAFAGTKSVGHGSLPMYSMTLQATITHTGAGSTSFDFAATNTAPEPSAVIMAVSTLPLLALYAWRRRKAQA